LRQGKLLCELLGRLQGWRTALAVISSSRLRIHVRFRLPHASYTSKAAVTSQETKIDLKDAGISAA